MKKSYVDLSGVTFKKVNSPTKEAEQIVSTFRFFHSRYGCRNIYQAYNRPSSTKCKIWENWLRTFTEIETETNGSIMVTVLGASCYAFSIGAYDTNNHVLYYITKSYNKMIEGVYLYD